MTASKATPAEAPPRPGERSSFIARQPIFTAEEKVFGYELLFRDGVEDYFREKDTDAASRRTLDTSLQIGLEMLCDGRRGFVNCTRDVLLKDYMTLLPSPLAVAEVLESVPPDDLVIAALQRLKQAGYLIALDDFTINDPRTALTEIADILKIDLRQTSIDDCEVIIRKHGRWRCRPLAEKVETREEFKAAKAAGFVYFQGYFFCRPEILHAKEIPGNKVNYLRMLKAVSQNELDVRELESIIKQEASVCYRLLRYLNSAAFGMQNEIHSIRHALTLLGEREVRRWVRLVATLGAGEKRSGELLLCAMVRARFCELLSPRVPHGESDLFLMGLLSLIDAIIEIPMLRVLDTIAVDHETKAALLGADGRLRPLHDLMIARESGDWAKIKSCSAELGISESEVAKAYWEAMQWARQIRAG